MYRASTSTGMLACYCSAGDVSKPNAPHKPLPANAGDEAIARLDKLRNAKGSLRTAEIRRNMQRVMQSDAAVFRTQSTLEEGCQKIDETVASFNDVKVRGLVQCPFVCDYSLRNMLTVLALAVFVGQ